MSDPLDQLVDAVRKSAKYRRVCEPFIRRIGAAELAKRPRLKEAIKATKNKLHQTGGAYLTGSMAYDDWLDDLRDARGESVAAFRAVCQDVMESHASTRERLDILDEMYSTVLGTLAPVKSVIDVACGLNPLAIPWMPLASDAAYYAYDIYYDMVGFLNGFFRLADVRGRAEARDMGAYSPPERADVALVLKTIPCLEQVDKAAGLRLLESLNARHLVISFPVRSLGGYDKGMVETYETHLRDLLAGKEWPVQKFEFDTELVFLVTKGEAE